MLISTKQRAQSIQLLPDTEITAINNSAFSNRSSSPRSCSPSSNSSNSDKNSPNSPAAMSDNTTTNTNLDVNDNNSSSEGVKAPDETPEPVSKLSQENATNKKTSIKLEASNDESLKESRLEDIVVLNENIKVDSIDEIYEYWKNFEIQKLKNDLNEQIEDILQCQADQDNLQSMYAEINQKLKEISNEEIHKTLSPYLSRFQLNLDTFLAHYKTTQSKGVDLLKLLTNVPDPFPVIELVRQFNESEVYEQAYKLQAENRSLQENLNAYKYEISLMNKQESRQIEEDKDLILNLSEQVGLTTSLNLELTSRLKLAEGEIESYKKILVDYQNEISDMKVKHLNEIKSEYSKESDKLKKIDSQSQISEGSNTTTTAIASTTNGVNNINSSATSKSDKLTNQTNNSLTKSTNSSRASSHPDSDPTMTTSSNKWMNGLASGSSVNTDRLALLQSLTAFSPNSKNTSATLKTLLNKTSSEQTQPPKPDSQFKPIYKIKSEDLDISSSNRETDTAYDSANDNDLDDSEQEVSNLKCPSPHSQQAHSNYEPINTADIAQKVRDLLSVHNIGQRVFAKFILGLSQGTVSELLSKPKHWDKLTEKGRESYRKMYNWSCSEHSISTLKAISPRKGNKDNYFYQNGASKEDTATEDRINQILSEAQRQMQTKRTLSGSPSPSGGSSAISASNNGSPSMSPSSHHDLLHKATAFLAHANHQLYSNRPSAHNYEHMDEDASMDEYEAACDSAARTQVRASQANKRSSNDNNNTEISVYPLDLTVRTQQARAASGSNKRIKVEDTQNNNEDSDFVKATKKVLAASSSNSVVSPLKHIQSIADAYLLSQLDQQSSKYASLQSPTSSSSFQRPSSTPSPALSGHGNQQPSSGSKALKCVLPPVSQDQFDRYSFINTEELVKKVKDLLSKFSISQRLFGECILGLSQGSVSDLLARPKPWQMLTQKGREPFIRMQMFIDDPEAIKKLMANQYKSPATNNASDKSSRPSGSLSSTSSPSPSLLQPSPADTTSALSKIVSQTLQSSNLFSQQNAQSLSQMFATITHTQNLLNLTQQQLQHSSSSHHTNENSNDSEMKPNSNNNNNNNNNSSSGNFQAQINIIPYDISTMSTVGDLNTEEITNRVKETLLNNNIGQKLFGEAVLNLSQGTVSELLSKPKPWNTLSIKGREPYLRMYMWLNDLSRLEKLNEWKEEKNLLKRSNTEVESDHQKPKRRFIFSEEQKDQLMRAFKYDPYPAVNQMEALAAKLNLQTRTVINWFHNHRMRIRYKSSTGGGQQLQHPSQSASPVSLSRSRSSNQNSFDEFTKSLQAYTNGGNSKNNAGSGHSVRIKSEGGNSQGRRHSSFYNYSNGNDAELMNDDDEGGYDEDDFNEASIDNNDESNVTQNNASTTEDEEMSNVRATKATLAMLNNAYSLPGNYFGRINSIKQQYENERSKAHTEDEDEDEDIHESSVQDDLDTDQEAEINSMYIPGDSDNNNNNINANNENNDDEEDYYDSSSTGNIYNNMNASNQYSSSDNDLKSHVSQSNINSGKRRKPHNPQKLSLSLNLLNTKLQQKHQQVGVDSEQELVNE